MMFIRQIHAGLERRERGWSLLETMAAIVIVGIGVGLFMKIQGMTRKNSSNNSNLLLAGQMIEKQIEDTRKKIVQNPSSNFPPKDTTFTSGKITLKAFIKTAYSPNAAFVPALTNVRKDSLVAYWGSGKLDTVTVVTYVSKNF